MYYLRKVDCTYINMDNSKICSFFGHREIEITSKLKIALKTIIESLILNENINTFYFGGFSMFDSLCYDIVSMLKIKYKNLKRVFCLNDKRFLINNGNFKINGKKYEDIIYLELDYDFYLTRLYYRNCEMIKKSEFVLFYVKNKISSGANKAMLFAKKIKKKFINLGSNF